MILKAHKQRVSMILTQALIVVLCLTLVDGMITQPDNLIYSETATELVDIENSEEEVEKKESAFDLLSLDLISTVDRNKVLESYSITSLTSTMAEKDESQPPELS
jgi:hypothetical protein